MPAGKDEKALMLRTSADIYAVCVCGHKAGEHWYRATGVEECGQEICPCRKFQAKP